MGGLNLICYGFQSHQAAGSKEKGWHMYREILNFWFEEIEERQWWTKDTSFDQLIVKRFSDLHKRAASCELYSWRESPHGSLAEIIILDQFSRNMFRDSPAAFACDPLALALAQEAIARKVDMALTPEKRKFLYMPFMHSESLEIHEVAMQLLSPDGEPEHAFELRHKNIIGEFGRYPHRNKILNRTSTAAELEFLSKPGSGF